MTNRYLTMPILPGMSQSQTQTMTTGNQIQGPNIIACNCSGPSNLFPGVAGNDNAFTAGTALYVDIENLDPTYPVLVNTPDGAGSPASNQFVLGPNGGRMILFNVNFGTTKASHYSWPQNWTVTGTTTNTSYVASLIIFG